MGIRAREQGATPNSGLPDAEYGQGESGGQAAAGAVVSAPTENGAVNAQTQEQRQQVLRQQQQRLLLLRHASKCPHG